VCLERWNWRGKREGGSSESSENRWRDINKKFLI